MKIGIDARMYGPKQTGIGLYVKQLIANLEKLDAQNQYVIFLRQENWEEYQPQNPNFKKVLANVHWYSWKEQIILPFILRKQKVDLMHFPHWNVPLFYRRPFVMTIHDLLLLTYPTRAASKLNIFYYWFKSLAHRVVLKSAVKHARAIAAVSKHTSLDVQKFLNVAEEKITVTHIAPHIFPELKNDQEKEKQILLKYKISKPYVLYLGNALPHKNLPRLIEAWGLMDGEIKNNYQLVLAGKIENFYKKLLADKNVKKLNDNLVFTNFVADEDVPALYKHAAAFVFPSLYEGFGMPPLEAMYFGVPVSAADTTSIPEVSRDGALYFDPKDPKNIASAIQKIITDNNLRTRLIARGKQVVTSYNWANTAQKTLEIYKNAS